MPGLERIQGCVFTGHLAPPDAARCDLTYRFEELWAGPLPNEVKAQRRSLGWSPEAAGGAISATVSLPALGLDREEVLASLDKATPDGSTRMLIQSLKKPELGLTVLFLAPDGRSLSGGDETWSRGDPPLISASRPEDSQSPSRGLPKPPAAPGTAVGAKAATPTQPMAPAPTAGSGARRPSPRRGLTVAPGTAAPPTAGPSVAAVGPSMPRANFFADIEPRYEDTNSVIGGECSGRPIAFRGDTDAARRVAASAKSGARASADASLRPDVLTGEPKRAVQLASASPGALDEEINAAEAEALERLVSAAAAGETGDIMQLSARVGLDKAPLDGRHAGMTPLMAAADRGRIEALKLLVEKKAQLEVSDPNGWTALMHAVHGQRPDAVKLLLDAKALMAVVAEADGKLTPLMLAASGARPDICAALLAAGAPREARDEEGRKALHLAAKKGNGGALVALLTARAKVEDRTKDGLTPLLLAAAAGRAESVKILIASRADVSAQDNEGRTVAKIASIYEHDRVLRVLSEAGG
mmetsp:Transcript_158812/g.509105  ORF Transcript_158812/g.509105 Transcript_158812/m.509105 type:complete len:528 (+) Transcript_158812:103-1686(+)